MCCSYKVLQPRIHPPSYSSGDEKIGTFFIAGNVALQRSEKQQSITEFLKKLEVKIRRAICTADFKHSFRPACSIPVADFAEARYIPLPHESNICPEKDLSQLEFPIKTTRKHTDGTSVKRYFTAHLSHAHIKFIHEFSA